jgi:hypothetical protein
VLPDFLPPGKLEISRIRANGVDVTSDRKPPQRNFFQINGLQGGAILKKHAHTLRLSGLLSTLELRL